LDVGSNQVVGQITREPANMAEMVTDADTYAVNFPPTADAIDKLLITGLALLIDYQFFESDADEGHNRRGSRRKSRRRRR
jgi:hypothetical protein